MNIKLFATSYSKALNKALDVYAKQHKAIAKNVANASNENYTRVNTDFSKELETARTGHLRRSENRHIQSSGEMNHTAHGTSTPEQVDLPREMAELAELQIRHDLVTRALNRFYNGVSNAITGKQG